MGCDLFVDASTLGAGFVMDAFRSVSRALRRKIFSVPLGALMSFAVLNPRGSDPDQIFLDRAGVPNDAVHPPVNYHAFAACTAGGFYRKDQSIPEETKRVMLLLRSDLKDSRNALNELRRAGKTVFVALKEAGAFQVAETLRRAGPLRIFQEICERADGAIATTPDLVALFNGAGARAVEFLPTPYPIEDFRWDFSLPVEERRGIFVGTREFATPSRNHLAALLAIRPLAEAMQEPVTVFNGDGWRGRGTLDRLRFPEGLLRVIEGRLPYAGYLRLMARHRLVWQLDASAVPGQVAGDALLCRVPCVGGNGTTERLVFPDLCGHGRTCEELFDLAARLLDHPHDVQSVMERTMEIAGQTISFTAIEKRLESLYGRYGR